MVSPLWNHCESPCLSPGNIPASNATHLDMFQHHSNPVSSIFGHRHDVTLFPYPQDLPGSKLMRINMFSCVSNLILLCTGPPCLSASIPTCFEAPWLNFDPNRTILNPGHLSYHLDDELLSAFASALLFQPEMTPLHFQSLLALKTMQITLPSGNCHPASPGPTRTNSEPTALS